MATRNKLIVPGAQEVVDQMKYEIAKELGVNFGRTATAQENGAVGGEITKRLIAQAKQNLKYPDLNLVLKKKKQKYHSRLPLQEVINMSSRNKLVVPGAQAALDQMKYEIAREFGVELGADTSSRLNGSVGGEITKRLVAMAQQQMSGTSQK